MGSYTFKWEHPAKEVFVTGTFDDWAKSVQLGERDGYFEKEVELPILEGDDKVFYKFVVDDKWVTNDSAPKESDGHNNYNNYLTSSDIVPLSTLSSAAPGSTTAALAGQVPKETSAESEPAQTMSTVTPESTTAALAGEVPKESGSGSAPAQTMSTVTPESTTAGLAGQVPKDDIGIPGAFPETPAPEDTSEPTFGVNPIPATSGSGNPVQLAPGEKVPDPSTLTDNTVQSTVKDDEELKAKDESSEPTFGVAPIPATAGAGNPIHLEPGEKVPDPSTLTSNTVDSTVKTDQASYEKSDAGPPQLGPVVTPEKEREVNGGMFSVPPVSGNMIPESSLPMGEGAPNGSAEQPSVFTQSTGPESTTAALAGQVPKEPRGVPEVVSESQKEAGVDPEASASPEAVKEKSEVEQELKKEVAEEPAATDSSATGKVAGAVTGGLAAVGAAAGAAALATNNKVSGADHSGAETTPSGDINPDIQKSIDAINAGAGKSYAPQTVADSVEQAHASPEAATNQEAVVEKKEVESELLEKVKPAEGKGEPAPVMSATSGPMGGSESSPFVPDVVTESQKAAHAEPEAAANSEAVQDKSAVEEELKKSVIATEEAGAPAPTESAALSETAPGTTPKTEVTPAPTTEGLNAPADKPAQSGATEVGQLAAEPTPQPTPSRDVSPMSKQPTAAGVSQKGTDLKTMKTAEPFKDKSNDKAGPSTPAHKKTQSTATAATPGSLNSKVSEDKKKKRRSIFGRIKDKFSSHDK